MILIIQGIYYYYYLMKQLQNENRTDTEILYTE